MTNFLILLLSNNLRWLLHELLFVETIEECILDVQLVLRPFLRSNCGYVKPRVKASLIVLGIDTESREVIKQLEGDK